MSLLAPLFLLGLLAALLPWWLHRLSASNPPQHDFSSSRFLEASPSSSSKKRKVKFLPLLLLRILFIGILSLLFAQPVIEKLRTLGTSDTRHILLIDTSLSQKLEGRWERSIEKARAILDGASNADEAVIISGSDRFVQAQSDNSLASAKNQLNTIEPGQSRLDYGRISSAIAAATADSKANNHLHIITDLQASAMPERFTSLAVDKVQNITIHSTHDESDNNVSVSARLGQINNGQASVAALINNYGEATTGTLTVTSNQQQLASETISLEANTSDAHSFSNLPVTADATQFEIEFQSNDDLSDDNLWLVPLPVSDKTEIVVLVNNNERSLAVTYAKAAIESDPRFAARLVEADRFSSSDAGNLVIVPDASDLSDGSARRLEQYIEEGGSVIVAAGSLPHSAQTRSLLAIDTNVGDISLSLDRRIGAVDNAHQVTANLENNWRAISIVRQLPLQEKLTDRVIIEMSDNTPLLIERQIGSGKMLLLATALNTTWTDLPTESVFVAFMIKAIDYLGGDTTSTLYYSTGDLIAVAAGAQLIDPDGQTLRDFSEISERSTLRLEKSGIYQLQNSAGTQAIAVNPDARESDITPIDPDTITQWQQMAISDTRSNSSSTTESVNTDQRSFWLWILPALLFIALLESLFSHRHLLIRREV